MRKVILISLLFSTALFIAACSQSNEPKPKEYKDPREMTWTVDTLTSPDAGQTLMEAIWASSPDDIYACGHCDDNDGKFWHMMG